ncbi:MAG: transglycosylase domain-containing protein [Eubacteriales bacterium]
MDNKNNKDNDNIIIESDRYDSQYINDKPGDEGKKSGTKKKPSKKEQRTKLKKFLKWFAISMLVLIVLGGGIGAALAYSWVKDAPALDLSQFEYIEPSYSVDMNGDFYQELQGKEKREILDIEEIPDMVKNAFIDIEDERFYSHKGVDVQGLIRAGIGVVISQSLSGPGGSTITQQLIKLTHLTPEKALQRKVVEMYLAMQLEMQYTKEQILEAYLNKVGFAYAWGVEAAAKTYFGKSVQDISVAQAAVLASIIKSPTYYKPYIIEEVEEDVYDIKKEEDGKIYYNEKNQTRALAVVKKMYELDHITKEERDEATEQLINNDFGLQDPPDNNIYSYFTDTLIENILDDLMASENFNFESRQDAETYLFNSGLKIYSTIDPEVQDVLDENFEDDTLFPNQTGDAEKASKALSEEKGEEINYTPEGAVTIVENSTGHVVGMIGGRNKEKSRSLNRATQQFQVGSSTKPLTVYGPALETKSVTLATTFDDIPIKMGSKKITNSPDTYDGMTTIRNGLKYSKNTIAVQTLYTLGVENSLKYGRMLGLDISEDPDEDLNYSSLALGGYTHGQSTLAMASAFSTFPNSGVKIEPVLYTRIEDRDGNTVLENKQEKTQVFSAQTTFLITDVLKTGVKGGTTTLYVPNAQIAGKTGTTNDRTHAYFCGYTPEYTAAVWYGYDQNIITVAKKNYYLNIGVSGGGQKGPAHMWEAIMQDIYKDKKSGSFPGNPGGIVTASVDSVSGKLPTELSTKDPRGSTVISEKFISGSVPSEEDDYHVEILMDMSTGKIASEFCPEELVEKVVRIRKPDDRFPNPVKPQNPNYVPKSETGVLAPDEDDICTVHKENTIIGISILKDNTPVENLTLDVGKNQQIKVVGVDRNNQYKEGISNVTMSSNNKNVTISPGDTPGVYTVTGVKSGNSTVTALLNYKYTQTVGDKKEEKTFSYTDTLTVAVNDAVEPPTVTLSTNSITLTVEDPPVVFNDPTVYINGKATNEYTKTITNKNGQVVSSIDTSAANTFTVVYKVIHNGLTGSSPPLTVKVQAGASGSSTVGFRLLLKFLFS